MKKILALCFVLALVSVAIADGPCYKPAPLPHYDQAKGYGYRTDVPCDNPDPKYKNSIVKTFQIGESREIFVDFGKDGSCDVMMIWQKKPGQDLWEFKGSMSCEDADKQISDFLRVKEGREEI